MRVYIVHKSIGGSSRSMDEFGYDLDYALEFNGEILGVFDSEEKANNLIKELTQKDYEKYGIDPNDEDSVEEYESVISYDIDVKDVM